MKMSQYKNLFLYQKQVLLQRIEKLLLCHLDHVKDKLVLCFNYALFKVNQIGWMIIVDGIQIRVILRVKIVFIYFLK
jgi:hypothetical protein